MINGAASIDIVAVFLLPCQQTHEINTPNLQSFKYLVSEDGRASSALENCFVLPWGQPADRQISTAASDVTPGEFVLRTLFAEFTVLAEKKIETVLSEPLVSLSINTWRQCVWFVCNKISEKFAEGYYVRVDRKLMHELCDDVHNIDLICGVQFTNN